MLSKNELLAAPAKPIVQSRNVYFDRIFYDIESLSPEEQRCIFAFSDHEGAIVVVPPRDAGRTIRYYKDTTDMLRAEKGAIGGVAVAGVGSSILGTCALARNVADTYDVDIAGIISGYGAADLITEAMGGWLFYGYTDRFRHTLEIMVENAANFFFEPMMKFAGASLGDFHDVRRSGIPRELDSGTLTDILRAEPENMEILVGHSKGALLIDFVLEEFVQRLAGQRHRYYDNLQVVTVSAVVGLPRHFKRTCQIMGALDWFGKMNSLPDLLDDPDPATQPKFIEDAQHHLNTQREHCLKLVDALGTHVPLQRHARRLSKRARLGQTSTQLPHEAHTNERHGPAVAALDTGAPVHQPNP